MIPNSDPSVRIDRRRLMLLAATFFCLFAGAGAQQAYLVRYLERVGGWNRVQCSLVLTTLYVTLAMGRTVNLVLFRKWSDRTFTIVGGGTYLAFTLAMMATFRIRSLWLPIGAAVVWGMGAAMLWSGATMQVLRIGDGTLRHGTASGVLYGATQSGWLTGAFGLGLLYAHLPDARLYVLYAAAALITLVGNVVTLLLPDSGSPRRHPPSVPEMFRIARVPAVRVASTLLYLAALGYGVTLGAFGGFVERTCGPRWVGVYMSVYAGMRAVSGPAAGRAADRFGSARVIFTGFLCAATGLLASAVHPAAWSAAAAAVGLGVMNGLTPVGVTAMLGDVPRERRPLVHGLTFSASDLGIATAAVGVNLLGLRFRVEGAFAAAGLVFAVCALLALRLGSGFKGAGTAACTGGGDRRPDADVA